MLMNWDKYGIDISKVSGGKGYCPKCHNSRKNKRDKSLSVDLNTGLFNCHNAGCDFSGCAKVFVPKKEYVAPQPRLQKVSDKVLSYFESRGITNNTLLAFKITEAAEWIPKDGKKVNCICFNYYRDDELVNIKFRSGSKGFKMCKDAELIFYNINAIADRTEVVITEGEIDCMAFYESGVYNAISVPNGASLGNSRLDYLDNCWDYFDGVEKIVIAVDGDDAGDSLKKELIRRFGSDRCYEVHYPEDCKDANEVLLKHGKDIVKKLYTDAQPLPIEGVETVLDKIDAVKQIYNHGYPKTAKISYHELNQYITWRTGELTTVTGIPNHGKSTWLNNIAVDLARVHGWKFAVLSPEKQPSEVLIAELCTIYIGKPFYRRNAEDKMNADELLEAVNFVDEHFYMIKTDEVNLTPDGVIEKLTAMVGRYGINAAIIDPWNYLEHNYDEKTTETKFVSDALTKFATFCKNKDVHTFLVAHPTKMQKDKDGKHYVPDMYSISGSAHFNNKTDNGITVYRDFENKKTVIYIQKIRWFYVGKTGSVDMYFDPNGQKFTEASPMITASINTEDYQKAYNGMPTVIGNKDDDNTPF